MLVELRFNKLVDCGVHAHFIGGEDEGECVGGREGRRGWEREGEEGKMKGRRGIRLVVLY